MEELILWLVTHLMFTPSCDIKRPSKTQCSWHVDLMNTCAWEVCDWPGEGKKIKYVRRCREPVPRQEITVQTGMWHKQRTTCGITACRWDPYFPAQCYTWAAEEGKKAVNEWSSKNGISRSPPTVASMFVFLPVSATSSALSRVGRLPIQISALICVFSSRFRTSATV